MVFSSTFFVFFFLPLVLLIYYISKEQYKNYILLFSSIAFYAYGEPRVVYIMLIMIVLNYIAAILIDVSHTLWKRNLLLTIDIIGNLSILYIFKYLGFTISIINQFFNTSITWIGLMLPIGISFYIFQIMSYVIDVYRKEVSVQKNIFNLALYVSFFPQLVAGPIVRYSSIEKQITNRSISIDNFGKGIYRFIIGFCKKVLLANQLALVAEETFKLSDYPNSSVAFLWLGSICFSLQIFYDFSGYSDMAIGLGKMFGFDFDENFNYPYISRSITEFWRRWHISLSSWFKDYVYIPLGGNRVNSFRKIFNLLIVWSLTGIWHGANFTFLFWGFSYFLLLIIEKNILRPEKRGRYFQLLWQILTLLCINFLWVIFNSSDLHHGFKYCYAMLGGYGNSFKINDPRIIYWLREIGAFLIIGCIFATPIAPIISKKLNTNQYSRKIVDITIPILLILLFLWSVSYLILGAHNPFIYFNF